MIVNGTDTFAQTQSWRTTFLSAIRDCLFSMRVFAGVLHVKPAVAPFMTLKSIPKCLQVTLTYYFICIPVFSFTDEQNIFHT
jgi:hypothetical protein